MIPDVFAGVAPGVVLVERCGDDVWIGAVGYGHGVDFAVECFQKVAAADLLAVSACQIPITLRAYAVGVVRKDSGESVVPQEYGEYAPQHELS